MGKTTIEWTDRTWNPVRGCTRVSEGCRNCYAERIAARFNRNIDEIPGPRIGQTNDAFHGFAIRTASGPRWTGKVELIESKLMEPLHWKKPQRVFVNSMSDLFHEALPDEAIDQIFAVMALMSWLTYQVLTKRHQRLLKYLAHPDSAANVRDILNNWADVGTITQQQCVSACNAISQGPLPNVWLGVSVENQATADARIPLLLKTPAAIRFVSYEPALGPVDFWRWLTRNRMVRGYAEESPTILDWIIAGGESGPGARPPHPDWFRSVRDQCIATDVPFFFKQWGSWREPGIGESYNTKNGRAGRPPAFIVQHNGMVECFKNPAHDRPQVMIMRGNGFGGAGPKNGGILDGREWKQFPLLVERSTGKREDSIRLRPNHHDGCPPTWSS